MAKIQINKHLGKVINGVTIGEETHRFKGYVKVDATCACGKQFNRELGDITSGRRSLCSKRSCPRSSSKRVADSPVYNTWCSMKERCNYTKHHQYNRYGGRNIKVCQEWLESFRDFETWALANEYAVGLQLDRINNDGNYEPGNCRFVTSKVNNSNKSNNTYVWLDGLVLTAAEASRQLGRSRSYVSSIVRGYTPNSYFPRLIPNPPKA